MGLPFGPHRLSLGIEFLSVRTTRSFRPAPTERTAQQISSSRAPENSRSPAGRHRRLQRPPPFPLHTPDAAPCAQASDQPAPRVSSPIVQTKAPLQPPLASAALAPPLSKSPAPA